MAVHLLGIQTVHTTGVNVEAVLSIAASVAILLTVALVPTIRYAIRSMKDTLNEIIDNRIDPRLDHLEQRFDTMEGTVSDLDRRMTRLEGVEEGKRMAIDLGHLGRPDTLNGPQPEGE